MAGRGRLIQTHFGGGEISRVGRARPDTNAYAGALEYCENFLVRPTGAKDRRGGTVRLDSAKDTAGPKRWFVLRKAINDVVRIEAGSGKFRFWDGTTRALIRSGGTPVEVSIPWSDADLWGVRSWQDGDVMWFAHIDHSEKVKVLKRTGATTFTLTDLDLEEGPFCRRTGDEPQLTFGDVSGSTSCTAASDYFTADMVGALIRVEARTLPDVSSWSFDQKTLLNEYCRNGNNIYECTDRNDPYKTGNNPPVHEEGTYWDGNQDDNIQWTFRGYTYGLARITAYASPTSVTVSVVQRLPFYGTQPKTSDYWLISALSGDQGWPGCGAIYEDRFALFGSGAEVSRCFLSRTEHWGPDSADFRPGFLTETVDTDAINRSLKTGETAYIVWAAVMDGLLLGTTVGVRQLTGPSADEGLTPAGAMPRVVTEIPCSPNLEPVKADNALLYGAVGDQELIEVSRAADSVPRNLLELADHMCGRGMRSLCWQGRPRRALWMVTLDGELRSLTYAPENGTIAWVRHILGGNYLGNDVVVDDACSAPGPDGLEEVWLFVTRTINGAAVKTVEYIAPPFRPDLMRVEDCCVLDGASYIDNWQSYTVLVTDLGGDRVRLTAQGGATPFQAIDVDRQFWVTGNASVRGKNDEPMPVKIWIDTQTSTSVVEGILAGSYDASLWKDRVLRVARPAKGLSGLSWLEGESVMLNADGRSLGPFTVSGGIVNLVGADGQTAWVGRGWVGLANRSFSRTLPVNGAEGLGSSRGAMGRVTGMLIMPDGIAEGRIRRANQGDDKAIKLARRTSQHVMGQAPPIEDSDLWIEPEAGYDRGKQMDIISDGPLPCSISGFLLKVESYG